MTAISYHDSVNDLQGPICWGDGPFARREWFSLLEAAGNKPLLAVAQKGDAALCLQLAESREGIAILTNWYAFTWEPLGAPALLEALARDLRTKAHRIVLAKLPSESEWLQQLTSSFRKAGWFVTKEVCDTNHVLHLRGRSYAQYLADRPGPLRTTLKRKAKKVDIAISTQFSSDDWQTYEEIYGESWKPEEGDAAMLRAFAQSESAAGRFRFGMARHEGEAVAAQFWTVDGGTAFIHKLAHREAAKSVSPGTSLTAALFEHVIERDKVRTVDFGTGDNPYKRDWMEEVRQRWQLTCVRPADPRNWPFIAKAMCRKLVSRGAHG